MAPQQVMVDGQFYYIEKLAYRDQDKLLRRLNPFFDVILPYLADRDPALVGAHDALNLVGPLMRIVGTMPDEDWDSLVALCLRDVRRAVGTGSVHVWNRDTDLPQFADIDLPQILQLMAHVLAANMQTFMALLPPVASYASHALR